MYYILVGKNPVAIPKEQFLEWGRWFELQPRHLALDILPPKRPLRKGNPNMLRKINRIRQQEVRISTVFLGLDHNHFGTDKPIVFETMIFGGKWDDYQRRYTTAEEATESHNFLVKLHKEKP
ncbi:hypothetical protein KI655_18455 [Vibrio sp. D404a]|uniref:hypothetical protein n=1 Tax=unclassified Vibrio TaxID=2614977 RepID=UPI0025575312|nr:MULTISPECIES: hypothetical protein [unclassified Vibrio]MDK9739280.1 hypothetical protein [Vibrio sp. D404a]MDK9797684.1 hypothetical protein [Vibrio sp. D449a]